MTSTREPRTRSSPPPRPDARVARPSRVRMAREVILGSERRLGVWMLPLFLLTAVLGATLAGGLVALYYSQQVAQLRETTAAARAQLDEAVERVDAAVETATTEIEDQVRRFREQLAEGLPIDSPNEVGVYALSAEHDDGSVRVASGFTVFSNEHQTFLVTSYAAVESGDGFAVERVQVFLPSQTVSGRVHGFDADLDLAVVVLNGGPVPVLEWRPPDQQVERGDAVYLVGVGGPGTATVAEARVAAYSERALMPTVPVNSFTAGGPMLDAGGHVVAVAALRYEPFGPAVGSLPYAVPIRRLCERLIRCTEADVGAEGLGEAAESPDDQPARGATSEGQPTPGVEPSPTPARPSPSPTAQPSPRPQPSPTGEADEG